MKETKQFNGFHKCRSNPGFYRSFSSENPKIYEKLIFSHMISRIIIIDMNIKSQDNFLKRLS